MIALLLAANPYTDLIDRSIDVPSTVDEAHFLRRAALDLLSRPPSIDELESFGRLPRGVVIERWLESEEAEEAWAAAWTEILIDPNARALRPSFTAWLAEERRAKAPWSETVTRLLTATGQRRESAPVNFLLAFGSVEEATGGVSRLFLGSSIQCAQCHDHPYQNIRMREFYGVMAFFAKSRARGARIIDVDRGHAIMPNGDVVLPRFLKGPSQSLDNGEERRATLARLISESPRFAEATVNRVWAQAMGRGLVENLDDLDEASEDSSGRALLVSLAHRFRSEGYALEPLIAGILGSRAYQASSVVPHGFEPRPKSPEQVVGSLVEITGVELDATSYEAARFVRATGAEPSIPRIAMLMNHRGLQIGFHVGQSPTLRSLIQPGGRRFRRTELRPSRRHPLDGTFDQDPAVSGIELEPEAAVERLFVIVLSRPPTPDEARSALLLIAGTERRQAFEDILWALALSAEAQTHL